VGITADFRREAAENCALLGNYAASGGNFFPLLAVISYHYSLRDNPEGRSSRVLVCRTAHRNIQCGVQMIPHQPTVTT